MENERTLIRIADITFTIQHSGLHDLKILQSRIHPFQIYGTTETDAVLAASLAGQPDLTSYKEVFKAGTAWDVLRDNQTWAIVIRSPEQDQKPTVITVYNRDFTEGTLYFRDAAQLLPDKHLSYLYGQLHLCLINLLNRGRGVIFHGCGVIFKEKGILFLGESGVGKTTTARLWKSQGAQVMSNDRVIVRRDGDGRLWLFGTPWCSEFGMGSPATAPLDHVLLIRHAAHNAADPLSPSNAVSRLVTLASVAYWDRGATLFTLDLLHDIAMKTPVLDFGFTPTLDAVEYLKCLLN